MFAVTLGVVLLIAILSPGAPLGRVTRELLIEAPVRKLKTFRRSHWIALLAAIGTMVAVFIYAKTEGAMFFASGLPETLQWFAIFDVATYMDVVGLLVLLAASIRFRAAYTALHSAIIAVRGWGLTLLRSLQIWRHARATRRRRTRSQGHGRSKDDDESWYPSFAFA